MCIADLPILAILEAKAETLLQTTKQTKVIPSLTFDPVALVEVDLSLSLGGVRANHHKMSPRNRTVQLSSGAYCLAVTAWTDREREKKHHWSGQEVKAQKKSKFIFRGYNNRNT